MSIQLGDVTLVQVLMSVEPNSPQDPKESAEHVGPVGGSTCRDVKWRKVNVDTETDSEADWTDVVGNHKDPPPPPPPLSVLVADQEKTKIVLSAADRKWHHVVGGGGGM